jgi:hypothetical protein
VTQPTHPIQRARGRLSWTAALAVQLQTRHQVDSGRVKAARKARGLAGTVLELLDQLHVERDPSERILLQESAREAAGTIVTLLAGTGARVQRPKRDAVSLDQALELLDSSLALVEAGLTGARHLALSLALIVRDGVDHLTDVEPAGELVAAP